MPKAKDGDQVKVHYEGTLDDGSVFDSSEGSEPLQFVVGSGQVIPGFNHAVIGLEVDESKTVTISEDNAYGPKRDELILSVPRGDLPETIDPEPGMQLAMQSPGGETIPVTIAAVTDEAITLDANHPLAGQNLTFKITLNAIEEADGKAETE